MLDSFDVSFFGVDYCETDVTKIIAAITHKDSLLAIGMPGCGKTRLIDFILHRPGVLEQSENIKAIWIDGDSIEADPRAMCIELLQALDVDFNSDVSSELFVLKNQLKSAIKQLEPELNLVVFIDNFSRSLQQALGTDFFDYLHALRNQRPQLNISYIIMANLDIEPDSFAKTSRLFMKGSKDSIYYLSLLNDNDTFASINRQLLRAGKDENNLNDTQKKRIYDLSGGHALLTQQLTHLMRNGEVDLTTEPDRILDYGRIRPACEAIWNDLKQDHQKFLVELAESGSQIIRHDDDTVKELRNYGVLNEERWFFSPVFLQFVKEQEITINLDSICCNTVKTSIIIEASVGEIKFPLEQIERERLLPEAQRCILCYLLSNKGKLCSRDDLHKHCWPEDDVVSDTAIDRHVERLSKEWLEKNEELKRYVTITIEGVYSEFKKLVITQD